MTEVQAAIAPSFSECKIYRVPLNELDRYIPKKAIALPPRPRRVFRDEVVELLERKSRKKQKPEILPQKEATRKRTPKAIAPPKPPRERKPPKPKEPSQYIQNRTERKLATHQRILDALEALKAKGEPFTRKQVEEMAGVTENYLSDYPHLRRQIREVIEAVGIAKPKPLTPEQRQKLSQTHLRLRQGEKEANHKRILDTLEAFIKSGDRFNLTGVERAAGFRAGYLSKHPELKERVRAAIAEVKAKKKS